MDDRGTCVRCRRNIDPDSRVCPFCSWDQADTPPPEQPSATVEPARIQRKNPLLKYAPFAALAAASILVIALVIAALAHKIERDNAREAATTANPSTTHERAARTPSPSSVELVPAGNAGSGGDQPLTSAPIAPGNGALANPYARDDATALSQSAYTQIAQLAKHDEARQTPNQPTFVDPRSITSSRFSGRAPRAATAANPATSPSESLLQRTEPVAVYQPVPAIRVDGDTTAHLLLTVSAEGRVTDVDVGRGLPGEAARLVDAVQEWRFRPATENGRPVASRFSVDITFHGNE
jgi:TonB family protein